jgi:hypothetical protein
VFIFYNFDFAGVAVWDGHTPFHTEFGTWSVLRNRLVGETWSFCGIEGVLNKSSDGAV